MDEALLLYNLLSINVVSAKKFKKMTYYLKLWA